MVWAQFQGRAWFYFRQWETWMSPLETCPEEKRLKDLGTALGLLGFVGITGHFPHLIGTGSTNGMAEVLLRAERGLELPSKDPFKMEIRTG